MEAGESVGFLKPSAPGQQLGSKAERGWDVARGHGSLLPISMGEPMLALLGLKSLVGAYGHFPFTLSCVLGATCHLFAGKLPRSDRLDLFRTILINWL